MTLLDLIEQYAREDRALREQPVPEAPTATGPRGLVFNAERAAQLRDYSGLRYGAKTPTDIDGFLDFNDRLFVILELKVQGELLGRGQRLALERLCDSAHVEGRRDAIVIVAEHTTPSQLPIDAARALVREYRYRAAWLPMAMHKLTARGFLDTFIAWKFDTGRAQSSIA